MRNLFLVIAYFAIMGSSLKAAPSFTFPFVYQGDTLASIYVGFHEGDVREFAITQIPENCPLSRVEILKGLPTYDVPIPAAYKPRAIDMFAQTANGIDHAKKCGVSDPDFWHAEIRGHRLMIGGYPQGPRFKKLRDEMDNYLITYYYTADTPAAFMFPMDHDRHENFENKMRNNRSAYANSDLWTFVEHPTITDHHNFVVFGPTFKIQPSDRGFEKVGITGSFNGSQQLQEPLVASITDPLRVTSQNFLTQRYYSMVREAQSGTMTTIGTFTMARVSRDKFHVDYIEITKSNNSERYVYGAHIDLEDVIIDHIAINKDKLWGDLTLLGLSHLIN